MPTIEAPRIDVSHFEIAAMLRCGRAIREATRGAATFEDAASAIVRLLYHACQDPTTGEHSCALVRFYKTHDYSELTPSLQDFAASLLEGAAPRPEMKTLTLLATAGDHPAWNDRRRSSGHQAIPLASEDMVRQAPMIAGLLDQFGLSARDVIQAPAELIPGREGKTYNVFHVERAAGSPFIPAQADFVARHGIASVVGFGGILRSGHLFATILFSRRPIPRSSADRFRALAVDVKAALFFLEEARTFAS